jgi:hypothetical protein
VASSAILGRSGRACPLAGATHWLSLAVRDLDEASMTGLDLAGLRNPCALRAPGLAASTRLSRLTS